MIESGLTQAQGSPVAITGMGTSRPETCALVYTEIENGNLGFVDLVQHAGSDDQIRTLSGEPVASVAGLTVEDG